MTERTESSVQITAAPGEVLSVIADFENYPQWAKEVREVRTLSHEGDGWADQVRFTLDAGVIKDTYVLDYDWDVAADGTGVVSWDLIRAETLKTLTGSYTLASVDGAGTGATEVTYRLVVDLKIPMLGMLKRKGERMIVNTALQSLRRRVESGA